ncbi:uncharacterized protein BT62DRAFT_1006073 [Guyanagaster necrorhizus]|uniref:Uncharacterized protein n=1 Tax=Guyanagaster necrorhizus TaxID=856835 RepID=A0A9P7VSZ3_9AGAR|nr:uncharacterized protein BT62DRAFT_1006073 [Guyanagaster necrorhizus MCA 3950]KAG7445890.1 hypothetical protein BT62DRAFT_1006073 [Guyanagaster necrorhizus MCA 3950]
MFSPASTTITLSLLRHGLQSIPFITRSAAPRVITCHHRTFRLKASGSKTAAARYDRYLKILEKKFEAAKERRDREEKDGLQIRTYPLDKDADSSTNPLFMFGSDGFMNGYNTYFWDHILSDEQRTKLKSYNITTYEELIAAANAAESIMASPPHPRMEQLKPRLRHAYQIKKDIDSKHTCHLESFAFSKPPSTDEFNVFKCEVASHLRAHSLRP